MVLNRRKISFNDRHTRSARSCPIDTVDLSNARKEAINDHVGNRFGATENCRARISKKRRKKYIYLKSYLRPTESVGNIYERMN